MKPPERRGPLFAVYRSRFSGQVDSLSATAAPPAELLASAGRRHVPVVSRCCSAYVDAPGSAWLRNRVGDSLIRYCRMFGLSMVVMVSLPGRDGSWQVRRSPASSSNHQCSPRAHACDVPARTGTGFSGDSAVVNGFHDRACLGISRPLTHMPQRLDAKPPELALPFSNVAQHDAEVDDRARLLIRCCQLCSTGPSSGRR